MSAIHTHIVKKKYVGMYEKNKANVVKRKLTSRESG